MRCFVSAAERYIVPNGNPALETFFIYGTEHYLQRTPRAALFNEF